MVNLNVKLLGLLGTWKFYQKSAPLLIGVTTFLWFQVSRGYETNIY